MLGDIFLTCALIVGGIDVCLLIERRRHAIHRRRALDAEVRRRVGLRARAGDTPSMRPSGP